MTKHIPPFVAEDIKKRLADNPSIRPADLQRALTQEYQTVFTEWQLKKFFKEAQENAAAKPAPSSVSVPKIVADTRAPAYDEILLGLYQRTAGKIPRALPAFKPEFPMKFQVGGIYVSSTLGPVIYTGEQSIPISGYGEAKVKSFESLFEDKGAKQKQGIATPTQQAVRKLLGADEMDTCLAFLLNANVEKPKDIPRGAKYIVDHFKRVSTGGDITDMVTKFTYICEKNREEDKSPAQFEYQFREKILSNLASEFAAIHGYDRDLCRQMLDQETRLPAGSSFRRMQKQVLAHSDATNVVGFTPRSH